jgi:hypothetical protein
MLLKDIHAWVKEGVEKGLETPSRCQVVLAMCTRIITSHKLFYAICTFSAPLPSLTKPFG